MSKRTRPCSVCSDSAIASINRMLRDGATLYSIETQHPHLSRASLAMHRKGHLGIGEGRKPLRPSPEQVRRSFAVVRQSAEDAAAGTSPEGKAVASRSLRSFRPAQSRTSSPTPETG